MKILRHWLPSILLILGSAVFLLFTLRGLGPSGTGVPAMLSMQSTWQSLPALHCTGTIVESGSKAPQATRFELWEARGRDRRVLFTDYQFTDHPLTNHQFTDHLLTDHQSHTTVVVITTEHAWKKTLGKTEELDPSRAEIFPLPDPDAPDATFYRRASRWNLENSLVFHSLGAESATASAGTGNGRSIPCTRVVGIANGARFIFDLIQQGPYSHLPIHIEIFEIGKSNPSHWTIDFSHIEVLNSIAQNLFEKP